MKDQPIAFKAEMIRALLSVENPKTQTRRLNLEKQYFVGQRLWVKEPWRVGSQDRNTIWYKDEACKVLPEAADNTAGIFLGDKWRSPMFMYRWASRITLEVTAVREERLQDITVRDCLEEGIPHDFDPHDPMGSAKRVLAAYEALWSSINGPGSWDENPVVKVISFRVVKP